MAWTVTDDKESSLLAKTVRSATDHVRLSYLIKKVFPEIIESASKADVHVTPNSWWKIRPEDVANFDTDDVPHGFTLPPNPDPTRLQIYRKWLSVQGGDLFCSSTTYALSLAQAMESVQIDPSDCIFLKYFVDVVAHRDNCLIEGAETKMYINELKLFRDQTPIYIKRLEFMCLHHATYWFLRPNEELWAWQKDVLDVWGEDPGRFLSQVKDFSHHVTLCLGMVRKVDPYTIKVDIPIAPDEFKEYEYTFEYVPTKQLSRTFSWVNNNEEKISCTGSRLEEPDVIGPIRAAQEVEVLAVDADPRITALFRKVMMSAYTPENLILWMSHLKGMGALFGMPRGLLDVSARKQFAPEGVATLQHAKKAKHGIEMIDPDNCDDPWCWHCAYRRVTLGLLNSGKDKLIRSENDLYGHILANLTSASAGLRPDQDRVALRVPVGVAGDLKDKVKEKRSQGVLDSFTSLRPTKVTENKLVYENSIPQLKPTVRKDKTRVTQGRATYSVKIAARPDRPKAPNVALFDASGAAWTTGEVTAKAKDGDDETDFSKPDPDLGGRMRIRKGTFTGKHSSRWWALEVLNSYRDKIIRWDIEHLPTDVRTDIYPRLTPTVTDEDLQGVRNFVVQHSESKYTLVYCGKARSALSFAGNTVTGKGRTQIYPELAIKVPEGYEIEQITDSYVGPKTMALLRASDPSTLVEEAKAKFTPKLIKAAKAKGYTQGMSGAYMQVPIKSATPVDSKKRDTDRATDARKMYGQHIKEDDDGEYYTLTLKSRIAEMMANPYSVLDRDALLSLASSSRHLGWRFDTARRPRLIFPAGTLVLASEQWTYQILQAVFAADPQCSSKKKDGSSIGDTAHGCWLTGLPKSQNVVASASDQKQFDANTGTSNVINPITHASVEFLCSIPEYSELQIGTHAPVYGRPDEIIPFNEVTEAGHGKVMLRNSIANHCYTGVCSIMGVTWMIGEFKRPYDSLASGRLLTTHTHNVTQLVIKEAIDKRLKMYFRQHNIEFDYVYFNVTSDDKMCGYRINNFGTGTLLSHALAIAEIEALCSKKGGFTMKVNESIYSQRQTDYLKVHYYSGQVISLLYRVLWCESERGSKDLQISEKILQLNDLAFMSCARGAEYRHVQALVDRLALIISTVYVGSTKSRLVDGKEELELRGKRPILTRIGKPVDALTRPYVYSSNFPVKPEVIPYCKRGSALDRAYATIPLTLLKLPRAMGGLTLIHDSPFAKDGGVSKLLVLEASLGRADMLRLDLENNTVKWYPRMLFDMSRRANLFNRPQPEGDDNIRTYFAKGIRFYHERIPAELARSSREALIRLKQFYILNGYTDWQPGKGRTLFDVPEDKVLSILSNPSENPTYKRSLTVADANSTAAFSDIFDEWYAEHEHVLRDTKAYYAAKMSEKQEIRTRLNDVAEKMNKRYTELPREFQPLQFVNVEMDDPIPAAPDAVPFMSQTSVIATRMKQIGVAEYGTRVRRIINRVMILCGGWFVAPNDVETSLRYIMQQPYSDDAEVIALHLRVMGCPLENAAAAADALISITTDTTYLAALGKYSLIDPVSTFVRHSELKEYITYDPPGAGLAVGYYNHMLRELILLTGRRITVRPAAKLNPEDNSLLRRTWRSIASKLRKTYISVNTVNRLPIPEWAIDYFGGVTIHPTG